MQMGVEKNLELFYRIEMKKYNQTVSDNSVKITHNMP